MQVVAFQPEAPGVVLDGRTEYCEREPLRRTLARHVALRCQHVLQRHHVPGLLDSCRREQGREHVPGISFLVCAHLLEPQSRLDVVAAAEIVPAAPLRRVPGKGRGLALVRIETGEEFAHGGEKIAGGPEPSLRMGELRAAWRRRPAPNLRASRDVGRVPRICLRTSVPPCPRDRSQRVLVLAQAAALRAATSPRTCCRRRPCPAGSRCRTSAGAAPSDRG